MTQETFDHPIGRSESTAQWLRFYQDDEHAQAMPTQQFERRVGELLLRAYDGAWEQLNAVSLARWQDYLAGLPIDVGVITWLRTALGAGPAADALAIAAGTTRGGALRFLQRHGAAKKAERKQSHLKVSAGYAKGIRQLLETHGYERHRFSVKFDALTIGVHGVIAVYSSRGTPDIRRRIGRQSYAADALKEILDNPVAALQGLNDFSQWRFDLLSADWVMFDFH